MLVCLPMVLLGCEEMVEDHQNTKIQEEERKAKALVLLDDLRQTQKDEIENRPTREYERIKASITDGSFSCKEAKQLSENALFTKEDIRLLKKAMYAKGLNSRDIYFILDDNISFGIGMSANGMECLGAYTVNEAYYQYSGHQWQMKYHGIYVYLKGNGKKSSMIVHSWN